MNHQPIVFVDVETTGGSAKYSRIIDLGAIRVENGKPVKVMNVLINPDTPIPAFITKLTGITNDMAWCAPSFQTIASEFEELLQGAIFAAHHVKFDYSFVKTEFKNAGVIFNHDRLCTVQLSRLLDTEYKRHGLDRIIERMGIEVRNRHRGYDDAEVLLKYFQYWLNTDPSKTVRALSQITTKSRKQLRQNSNQQNLAF